MDLTLDIATSRLSYDPETGALTWLHNLSSSKAWNTRFAGKSVGCIDKSTGYIQFTFCKKRYLGHRVCFLLHHGFWPDEVDHINGCRGDNRIANLRSVSHQDNMKNLRPRSSLHGYHNIYLKRGKWQVRSTLEGKRVSLGCYEDIKDALRVQESALKDYGYHYNHGKKV